MTLLNAATAMYVGDVPARAVYVGDQLVWSSDAISEPTVVKPTSGPETYSTVDTSTLLQRLHLADPGYPGPAVYKQGSSGVAFSTQRRDVTL